MPHYNNSTPFADWSGCQRCSLCTTRTKVVVRRSGLVQRGAITRFDINMMPFNKEQRELIMKGMTILDSRNELKWLHPHLTDFILRNEPASHILIYGEAPGELEDKTGLPFWGPAGHILDCVLHLTKSTFFFTMTNTVCCRPFEYAKSYGTTYKKNRQPSQEEQDACYKHVLELIAGYDLAGIITLGDVAHKSKTKSNIKLPHLHLKHPSWILRQNYHHRYNQEQALEIDKWLSSITST